MRAAMLLAIVLAVISIQAAAGQTAKPATPRPPAKVSKPAPVSRTSQQKTDENPLKDFQNRLDKYLQLRQVLSKKLKPLSSTGDAAELAGQQDALAAALRAARSGNRRGDLIPEPVAQLIRDVIVADFRRRLPAVEKAELAEVPVGTPAVNMVYPPDAALPTMPALVLAKLPKLPDNLQYRYFGRHVVLLDGDTQIVLDYIPGVLPPH
jgi:hypothetical protein